MNTQISKIIVNYCESGNTITEFNYELNLEKYTNLVNLPGEMTFNVSTELGIYLFRILVCRGIINPSDIIFKFPDNTISTIEKPGHLSTYPLNYLVITDKILEELIGWQYPLK